LTIGKIGVAISIVARLVICKIKESIRGRIGANKGVVQRAWKATGQAQ